jgi:GT2 family glycosyltransferase
METVAIVVPVYNGTAETERCLAALARRRPPGSTVVLVDDASTDPAIAPLLEGFARAQPGVSVVRSPENRGYVQSANLGAAQAPKDADLIFLNSDTEVAEGWHEAMEAALRHPDAAACSPLSNNASYLSIPKFQQPNELPTGFSAEDMAALVRACAGQAPPVTAPTPVGFCMRVRRSAWDRFGPFDEAFGRGYGEEDDFGQRVQAAGGVIVCATRGFVYHRGGASFAGVPEVSESRRANGALLASRWPGYADGVRTWCQTNPLRPLHERIWEALLKPAAPGAIHVLHALERWELSGALRENLLAIVRATREFAMHTIVVPMPDRGAWMDAIDFEHGSGVRVVGLIDFEERFARFLAASPADLVHFHDPEAWMPPHHAENARRQRPVLTTPGGTLDPARCAGFYRRVGDAGSAAGSAVRTRP